VEEAKAMMKAKKLFDGFWGTVRTILQTESRQKLRETFSLRNLGQEESPL
jgi:hypothetical protein